MPRVSSLAHLSGKPLYVRELKALGDLIRAQGGRVHRLDNLRYGPISLASLVRMVRRRSIVIMTDSFAL